MIELTLPIPISVNQAYAGFKRRFKSKPYKEYEKSAKAYYEQNYDEFDIPNGKLKVTYRFLTNWHNKDGSIKKKDVFNYEKVLSDKLSDLIPTFEDENIWKGVVEKVQSDKDIVEITIEEYKS